MSTGTAVGVLQSTPGLESVEAKRGTDGTPRTVLTFEDTDARDAYLEEHFPWRECAKAPGFYRAQPPRGRKLAVFTNTVTIYEGDI